MTRISWRPRTLALAVAVLGSVGLLTACDKPMATLTVLTDTKAQTVSAQPVCTMLGTGSACALESSKTLRISAAGGSKILIDVPKKLADSGWIVTAYTTDGTKNTALTSPGASSGTIRGDHSVRLTVPSATVGSYFLQVTALKPSSELTTWLVGVTLKQ